MRKIKAIEVNISDAITFIDKKLLSKISRIKHNKVLLLKHKNI